MSCSESLQAAAITLRQCGSECAAVFLDVAEVAQTLGRTGEAGIGWKKQKSAERPGCRSTS